MDEKSIFTGSKAYLEKSFLEELAYKVWTTKGARFKADERLRDKAKMSSISMSIFSAYLIIAGLISVYVGSNTNINFQLINYFVTALSIILLVLSQYESSQDYKLRAIKFHECALEISDLYNELRIFKTLGSPATIEETKAFCQDITKRYEAILCKYENHLPIDYDMFRVSKADYFSELKNDNRTFSNAYVKFGVDYFFEQNKFFSAYGTETATPAYTLLNAGIGTNINAFNRGDFMSLYISGENLADVTYQSHLSRLKYASENPVTGRMGVFNMGRNVSVKLIMNF